MTALRSRPPGTTHFSIARVWKSRPLPGDPEGLNRIKQAAAGDEKKIGEAGPTTPDDLTGRRAAFINDVLKLSGGEVGRPRGDRFQQSDRDHRRP